MAQKYPLGESEKTQLRAMAWYDDGKMMGGIGLREADGGALSANGVTQMLIGRGVSTHPPSDFKGLDEELDGVDGMAVTVSDAGLFDGKSTRYERLRELLQEANVTPYTSREAAIAAFAKQRQGGRGGAGG